jgi:hypothetical protein
VVLDVDYPKQLDAELQTTLAASGAPYQSTRPDDAPGRGHYIFRQPADRQIGCSAGGLAGMGLDVKGAGGVIILEPTYHPAGGEYRWIKCGAVPELPAAVAEKLTDAGERESAATDAEVEAFLAEHTGASRPQLFNTWPQKFADALARYESRHTTMARYLPAVAEEAMAGYYAARPAVDKLRAAFLAAKFRAYNGKAPMDADEALDAFNGILAWAIGQAKGKTVEEIREKVEANLERNSVQSLLSGAGQAEATEDPDPSEAESGPGLANLVDLEQGFWQSRESLTTIYEAALARMCSPWAVLGCCVARVLTQIPPHIVLPDVFGTFGSLNWFGAIAAPSGGGKGMANGLARRLVGEVNDYPLGSGEGMVNAFWRNTKTDEGKNTLERIVAVMFDAPEIDALAALGARSGSTLMSTLRKAFSGERLGFGYKQSKDSVPSVAADTYRLTFLCSVQPGRAAALLGDADGGTPQRFMWFPGVDSRLTLEAFDRHCPVPELVLPSATMWQYRTEVRIPAEAEREIVLHRARSQSTFDVDPLDGHAMFEREKFAFALAVLDGRNHIDSDDWRLSGIAAKVSDATRDWVKAGMAEAERTEAARAGRLTGERLHAASEAKADAEVRTWNRIADKVVRTVGKAGPEGMTEAAARRDAAGRDRKHITSDMFAALAATDPPRLIKVPRPPGDQTDRWRVP